MTFTVYIENPINAKPKTYKFEVYEDAEKFYFETVEKALARKNDVSLYIHLYHNIALKMPHCFILNKFQ